MEFNKLVKNTSFLMIVQVFKFLAGIIRAKFNAIYLGTFGVGVVNQIGKFSSDSSRLTQLSMNNGLVKIIAESKNKEEASELICSAVKVYFIIISAFVILVMGAIMIFYKEISYYIFGSESSYKYLIIGLISFPLLVLNSIPYSVLRGYKDIKEISKSQVIHIVVDLIIFLPLLYFFGLTGAIIFIPLSFLILIFVTYYLARKYHLIPNNISIGNIVKAKIRKPQLKELYKFAGIGTVISLFAILSEQITRSIVVTNLGIEKIGLYNPIITWSNLFVGFILPSFYTYLYTRFCESNSNTEISGILNDAIRLSTLLLFPLLLLAIPFQRIIIPLFYSMEFIDAAKYLPYHFIGLVLYVWFYALTMVMAPTGRIVMQGILLSSFHLLKLIVVYIFVPQIGLYGWMLKFIIPPFIFFIIYYLYLNNKLQFRILPSNKIIMFLLLFYSVILIVIEKILHFDILVSYILGPLFLFSLVFFISKSEKLFIINKLTLFYGKFLKK
jgi:O-antigen/teichoic acid export membrane protein